MQMMRNALGARCIYDRIAGCRQVVAQAFESLDQRFQREIAWAHFNPKPLPAAVLVILLVKERKQTSPDER
ncbi:hypothetical protein NKH86_29080 [Mesorhizobium sp. M0913]